MSSIHQEGGELGRGEHGYCLACTARKHGSKNCDPALLKGAAHRIPFLCVDKDRIKAEIGGAPAGSRQANPYEMLRNKLRSQNIGR